jgi:uncharacterized membrane protein YedE/YeeE
VVGILLGVIFIKSEVASWFRIQEMFRFQAFHMYGVIGSAVAVAALSIFLMKRMGARARDGSPIDFRAGRPDTPGVEHALGGALFGLGWGLTGACPGPIYALIGSGGTVMVVVLASAVLGAWTYAALKSRLPHGPPRRGRGLRVSEA